MTCSGSTARRSTRSRYLIDTGARHMLVIGAYRDNEVARRASAAARRSKTSAGPARTSSRSSLGPLPVEEVARFLADALRDDIQRVEPLAQLVHDKTGGNPFFVIQFILALRDDGLLDCDGATSHWRWDLARIVARGFTDNLADFMVAKLARLSRDTRELLMNSSRAWAHTDDGGARSTDRADRRRARTSHCGEAVHAGLVVRTRRRLRVSPRSRAGGKPRAAQRDRARRRSTCASRDMLMRARAAGAPRRAHIRDRESLQPGRAARQLALDERRDGGRAQLRRRAARQGRDRVRVRAETTWPPDSRGSVHRHVESRARPRLRPRRCSAPTAST